MKAHKNIKHKTINQIDGYNNSESENDTEMEYEDEDFLMKGKDDEIKFKENETLEQKVNVTFVSASLDDAKDELMEYYLKDFNVKEDDIKYDKEQIGDAYEGDYDFSRSRTIENKISFFQLNRIILKIL